MKRKDFILGSSFVLGGTLLGCKAKPKENQFISAEDMSLPFDLHTHPGLFFMKGTERYTGDQAFVQRVAEMKSNGVAGAFFSLVADWPLLKITKTGIVPNGKFTKDEGWKVYLEQMATLKELISQSDAQISTLTDDLTQGETVKAYISSEGGDFLGGEIDRLQMAYDDGVRSIQLVHYAPNDLGDLQTWKSEHNGLSEFGKVVVTKMNDLGMLIDVAHASAKTVKDVVDSSTAPVMLSHSILKDGKHGPVSARAISIEHAKMVTSNGGIIGAWPSGFSTSLDDFVDHTLRLIDVVGINHVAIGTDMDANYKPVIKDYAEFNTWVDALAARGLSSAEVNKVTGGNARRLLREVIG